MQMQNLETLVPLRQWNVETQLGVDHSLGELTQHLGLSYAPECFESLAVMLDVTFDPWSTIL